METLCYLWFLLKSFHLWYSWNYNDLKFCTDLKGTLVHLHASVTNKNVCHISVSACFECIFLSHSLSMCVCVCVCLCARVYACLHAMFTFVLQSSEHNIPCETVQTCTDFILMYICAYMYTCKPTHTLVYIQNTHTLQWKSAETHTHTHTYACLWTCTWKHTLTHTHTCAHMHAHTHTHTHTNLNVWPNIYKISSANNSTHMHKHGHACAYTHTHTSCTHTQTQPIPTLRSVVKF